jgi:hypothetical protein
MSRFLGKWTPAVVGVLFLYSGLYKLVQPSEATLAVAALGPKLRLASLLVAALTVLELYLGLILILRLDIRYGLWVATGLMFAFTTFLWYISLMAHPPPCGCMGLTHVFLSNRHNAVLGIFRNVVILWLLTFAYDYYVKSPPPRRAA